jgi:hypothetical protein
MDTIERMAGVDAGCIWIGDPCYLFTYIEDEIANENPNPWGSFLDSAYEGDPKWEQPVTQPLGPMMGTLISHFGGDGVFPIEIHRNEHGMVTHATIKFYEYEEESNGRSTSEGTG